MGTRFLDKFLLSNREREKESLCVCVCLCVVQGYLATYLLAEVEESQIGKK